MERNETRITAYGLTPAEYQAFHDACADLERSTSAQARLLIREFLRDTLYSVDTDKR